MINAMSLQTGINPFAKGCPDNEPDVLSPTVIRYQSCPQGGLARQILIFESAPSINKASKGIGTALVELEDGRVFFFRTSLAVMDLGEPLNALLKELCKLPEWVTSWRGAAELVGFMIGAPFEFIEEDPGKLDNWNIQGWKQHAAARLALNRTTTSIQKVSVVISEAGEKLRAQLSERTIEFLEALDQSAIGVQGQYRCAWHAVYNFLTRENEKQRLYRRQASLAFPMVVEQLFLSPKEEVTAAIIRAIDEGVPLVDFLATLFTCQRKYVRHLNGLRFEDVGNHWGGRLRELMTILSGLDVNRLPKNRAEWSAFYETINLVSAMTKTPITSLSGRLLLGELSSLHWGRKIDASARLEERAFMIERFAENIRVAIVATAWANDKDVCHAGGVAARLAAEAACSLGLPRLQRLSRKWRAEELRLDSEWGSKDKHHFPVVLDEPLAIGDLKIFQLTNASQLKEEGERMSNCVASYKGECSRGQAVIFSIRDKSGASCVTIEYGVKRSRGGRLELILVQQKGKGNKPPEARYQVAIKLLDRFAKSPDIQKKLVNLLICQKALEKGETDTAKYLRSLAFGQFIERETAGRINFQRFVADVGNDND